MMNKTAALLFSLLLTACSSADTAPKYYAIALPSNDNQITEVNSKPLIAVQSVVLADYLSNMGIMYQQNDVQLISANKHRWAESLDKQLTRSLLQSLRTALPDYQWQTDIPTTDETPQLSVSVQGFHGLSDGGAMISGEWRLLKGGKTYSGDFKQRFELKEDGYPALVRTLSDGWQTTIQKLSVHLKAVL